MNNNALQGLRSFSFQSKPANVIPPPVTPFGEAAYLADQTTLLQGTTGFSPSTGFSPNGEFTIATWGYFSSSTPTWLLYLGSLGYGFAGAFGLMYGIDYPGKITFFMNNSYGIQPIGTVSVEASPQTWYFILCGRSGGGTFISLNNGDKTIYGQNEFGYSSNSMDLQVGYPVTYGHDVSPPMTIGATGIWQRELPGQESAFLFNQGKSVAYSALPADSLDPNNPWISLKNDALVYYDFTDANLGKDMALRYDLTNTGVTSTTGPGG